MIVDEKTRSYIAHQLEKEVVPTEIVEKLVAAGWSAVDASTAVQEVSGVQLAAPGGGRPRPPLVLKVVYVLSFLMLLVGIGLGVAAVVAIGATTNDGELSGFGTFVGAGLGTLAIIYIASFFLIKDMKNGSLRALKILTGLVALAVIGQAILEGMGQADDPFRSVNPLTAIGNGIGSNIVQILFLGYIWWRHRPYFH